MISVGRLCIRTAWPKWLGLHPVRNDVDCRCGNPPREWMLLKKMKKTDPETKLILGGIFLGVKWYVAFDWASDE